MSLIQIEKCAARIHDRATRERFERMMKLADDLTFQAAQLRREAWADFRLATGEVRRDEKVISPYA